MQGGGKLRLRQLPQNYNHCICTQAFAAHKGEITCMLAGPGGRYMVTGGVDFQVCRFRVALFMPIVAFFYCSVK